MRLPILLLAFIIIAGACSSPKKTSSESASSTSGTAINDAARDGSSYEKAIVIKAKNESAGVSAEYKWLSQNYPGYTLIHQSLMSQGKGHYDVLKIKTADGEEKDIYFDITNFFGKW